MFLLFPAFKGWESIGLLCDGIRFTGAPWPARGPRATLRARGLRDMDDKVLEGRKRDFELQRSLCDTGRPAVSPCNRYYGFYYVFLSFLPSVLVTGTILCYLSIVLVPLSLKPCSSCIVFLIINFAVGNFLSLDECMQNS